MLNQFNLFRMRVGLYWVGVSTIDLEFRFCSFSYYDKQAFRYFIKIDLYSDVIRSTISLVYHADSSLEFKYSVSFVFET